MTRRGAAVRADCLDGLSAIHLPLDAIDDCGFWDDWMHGPEFATALY